jgi:hypothetical protein
MKELFLDENTRSDRKWAWTYRNKARAVDIRLVMDEQRRWWPLTARRVFYLLISSDAVDQDHWYWKGKQVDVYKALGRTLKWMRIDDMLSMDAIIDEHRAVTDKKGYANVREFVETEIYWFLDGYSRCMAQKQRNYIEVWIEKAALLHIVKPEADKFCRRVVTCKGYNSISFQTEFYKRATDAIGFGQQPIVLYLGDWDPSGVNMIYAAMQTLSDELELDMVKYIRVGINPEQFDMIQKNPVPIKRSDTRSRSFIERYGTTAYELDALDPEQIQKLVRNAIEAFTDMRGYEENSEHEQADRNLIGILKKSALGHIEQEAAALGIY